MALTRREVGNDFSRDLVDVSHLMSFPSKSRIQSFSFTMNDASLAVFFIQTRQPSHATSLLKGFSQSYNTV